MSDNVPIPEAWLKPGVVVPISAESVQLLLEALRQAQFAMSMENWHWDSVASTDFKRAAYKTVQEALDASRVPVIPATKEDFPYTRTFNAIAAAARLANGGTAIGISVQAFIDAWNAHPTSGVLACEPEHVATIAFLPPEGPDGIERIDIRWCGKTAPYEGQKLYAAAGVKEDQRG